MARTVARAIQDLLGDDSEQPVKIRLASGSLLMGWLEDLQQFDEAAMLVEPNGRRTVIPMASIAAIELGEVNHTEASSPVKQVPRLMEAGGVQPAVIVAS